MDTNTVWRESTQKIYWGVMMIAIAGIFNTIYDYFAVGINMVEMIRKALPYNLGSPVSSYFSAITYFGMLAKLVVINGYVFYLLGLKHFADIQTDNFVSDNIGKVRTAVIMMICSFVASLLLSVVPLVSLVVWIITLVALVKMKNAFAVLETSPVFSPLAKTGAHLLRRAAYYNIIMMVLPVCVIFFILLILWSNTLGGDAKDLFELIAFIAGGSILVSLILMVLAFFYPLFGWRKIMDGGPAYNQQMPVTQQHVQIMREQSNDTVQKVANVLRNNKNTVCAAAAFVLGLLLCLWLAPKLFGEKTLTYEKYEIESGGADVSGAPYGIHICFDIPQGNGDKAKNVQKAMREIIAQSAVAEEYGAPVDGSLKEIADDYKNRIDKHMTEGDYGSVQCDLGLQVYYQNELLVVYDLFDGIFGNGGPAMSKQLIRLSDGHIMETAEVIEISDVMMENIIKRYYVDGDYEVMLKDGFELAPVSADSCMVVWPVSSHIFEGVEVPLRDLSPYLTDEGRNLFTAKPYEVKYVETGEGEKPEDNSSVSDTDEEVGRGDLGVFDLRGSVKMCIQGNRTLTFSKAGEWLTENGKSLKTIYKGGVIRDGKGRLSKGLLDMYGETYHEYTLNNKGLVVEINFQDYLDGGTIYKYSYDGSGHVAKEIQEATGMDALEEDGPTVCNYTILETDSHDNWTKRKDQNGNITTRQITYY